MLSRAERAAYLTLGSLFTPGSHQLYALLEEFGSASALMDAILEGTVKGLPDNVVKRLKNRDPCENSFEQIEGEEKGIHIMAYKDRSYPDGFLDLSDPPIKLYTMGDLKVLKDRKRIAIVGARSASDYSLAVARRFALDLAAAGYVIVSGFAKGIDSICHQAAMDAGGETIAVLGSGILYDYPKKTLPFKHEIARHGIVISEYSIEQTAQASYFPVRNRMITALADAVLVIEAKQKSGCHNTVGHALKLGKEVFVIPPHDLFTEKYSGNSILIRDGAVPVCSPHDVIVKMDDIYNMRNSKALNQIIEDGMEAAGAEITDPSDE